MTYSWWELCRNSSQYLMDVCVAKSWQAAKAEFTRRGWYGKYLLIHRTKNSFKVYNINIPLIENKKGK